MTIDELLNTSKGQFSLELFSQSVIAAVENALIERNGKYYLTCCSRTKEVVAKPEEIIRQLWLQRLQLEFKYPQSRIAVEYPITFGRATPRNERTSSYLTRIGQRCRTSSLR